VEHKKVEIFSVKLRTGWCLLEAAAVASTVEYATTNTDATKERMLQRTVFINLIRVLQRTMLQRTKATTNGFYQNNQYATSNTNATTNENYNEQFLSKNQDDTTNTDDTKKE